MPHLNRNVHHEYSAPENVRRRDRRRLRMRVCSRFHGCFDSRSGDWKTRVESGLADKEHHRQYLADFPGVRLLKEPRCEIDGTAGWRQLLCLRHCPMYASAFEVKIQPPADSVSKVRGNKSSWEAAMASGAARGRPLVEISTGSSTTGISG